MKRIFTLLTVAALLCSCGGKEKEQFIPDPDNNPEQPGGQTPGGGEDKPGGDDPSGGDDPVDAPDYFSNDFMRGSTTCFAQYMMDLGLKYRENGAEKNPYASLKEHGANIVRLQLNFEDFDPINGTTVDWASWNRVVADAKSAYEHGLDILLTLKPDADIFHETASTEHNRVPKAWQSMSESQLGDALYAWVYESLEKLAREKIYPRVVAVGNEVNVEFLAPVTGYKWDIARHARLLNRGFAAVRDYAAKYNPNVRSLLHLAGPDAVEWYVLRDMKNNGCTDFDIVGLSWYPGEGIQHKMGSGTYATFAGIGSALRAQGYDFMIIETARTFAHDRGDNCNNSYNDPAWAQQTEANTSPAQQRKWLADLANEIKAAGGVGVITWGTESLPDDGSGRLYTYPVASWAHGSTWENNSYWDFRNGNNLHEGIDWMRDVQ